MLKKLSLENFQKHQSQRVDFDPAVTVIVGPSDAGKSTLIRAIRWVVINRPLGDGFVKRGEKRCCVKLLANGKTIRRKRSTSGENLYEIEEKKFEAFGNSVPPEVTQAINLSEVNIQSQHDAPYWMNLSGGELAKELNKIVDLESIDRVTEKLASRMRGLQAEKGVEEERLSAAKERQTALGFVPVLDKELLELEEQEQELLGIRERCDTLSQSITEVKVSNSLIKKSKRQLKQMNEIIELGEEWKNQKDQFYTLKCLQGNIQVTQQQAKQKIPDLKDLTGLADEWRNLQEDRDSLAEIICDIEESQKNIKDGENELEIAKRRMQTETGGLCPICGGKLK